MASMQKNKNNLLSLSTLAIMIVVLLCLSMIGATGYVKYQLDRSEAKLAAPDSAFSADQELYEKTVLALGYSGFLSSAQNFMTTHDRAALGDMRMNLKTAREAVSRLGDKAPTAVRRDLDSILNIFSAMVTKAEETDAMSNSISSMDIMNAATSLATLDMRLQAALASNRATASTEVKMWSMSLMLMAWASFATLAGVCLYTFLRSRRSLNEPIQSLAQSVENLAGGDMESPIWGIARRDEIGTLARALDRARIEFGQIPDLTVQSDEGPVHLRFEGEARSIFHAMMKNIAETFERTQQSAASVNSSMNAQQDVMTSLNSKLSAVLGQMQHQGVTQMETVDRLTESLKLTAQTLAETQEINNAQVGRLVPYMQERIQNMAEVTSLAGNQVTQSLQTLLKAESALRNSAGQSEKVVQQLANATNQMGERMFAALNLMQASGKMLNETTDMVKSRFNDAVQALGRGEGHLRDIIDRAEERLSSTVNAEENMAALAERTEISAVKMEKAVNNICDRHEGLSEQVVVATHRMESIVASFDSAQRAMSEATAQVRRDGNLINSLLMELRANNDQLLSSVASNSQTSFTAVQSLAEKSHALMQRLEVQIGQQAQVAETRIDELTSYSKVMAQQATSTTSTLAQTVASLKSEQDKLAAARSQFTETISDIGARFEQQATSTFGKTEQWAAQSFSKLTTIAEQVEGVMQRLGMLGQLTGTLGAVAGQLGQLVPALSQLNPEDFKHMSTTPASVDLTETKALLSRQTEDMMQELNKQWHEAVAQIEAMHDQLAQMMVAQKDQLETRLVVMDKKLRETADNLKEIRNTADEPSDSEERQAEIMNEIISAISKINEHVIELDGAIEDAGLKKEA